AVIATSRQQTKARQSPGFFMLLPIAESRWTARGLDRDRHLAGVSPVGDPCYPTRVAGTAGDDQAEIASFSWRYRRAASSHSTRPRPKPAPMYTTHSCTGIASLRTSFRIIWFCARNGTANCHSWFFTGFTISTMVGMIGRNISTLM